MRDLRITHVLHLHWRLGFLASPIVMTSSKIRIDPRAASLSSNNSRIRPTSTRQNLNIAGYTDVTDAEVVATTT